MKLWKRGSLKNSKYNDWTFCIPWTQGNGGGPSACVVLDVGLHPGWWVFGDHFAHNAFRHSPRGGMRSTFSPILYRAKTDEQNVKNNDPAQ